jgi:hypothetical protein
MSHSFGLVIESLVAVLLLVTIAYCMLLNRRLKRLKADEQSMRAMIAELITATGTTLSAKLAKQVTAGESILNRLTQIALAARPAGADVQAAADVAEPTAPAQNTPAQNMSNAKALLAAAQAFSERRRTTGLAA